MYCDKNGKTVSIMGNEWNALNNLKEGTAGTEGGWGERLWRWSQEAGRQLGHLKISCGLVSYSSEHGNDAWSCDWLVTSEPWRLVLLARSFLRLWMLFLILWPIALRNVNVQSLWQCLPVVLFIKHAVSGRFSFRNLLISHRGLLYSYQLISQKVFSTSQTPDTRITSLCFLPLALSHLPPS